MYYSHEFEACNNTVAEIFLPVAGFPDYYVSNLGRVRSHKLKTPTILRNMRAPSGYLAVDLYCGERKRRTFYVHRLVIETFLGPCPAGLEVCHNDGDALNPTLSNLRYDSAQANQADRVPHGTRIPKRPFTEAEVRDILTSAAMGETILSQSARLGAVPGSVAQVRAGNTYRYYAPELKRGFKRSKV